MEVPESSHHRSKKDIDDRTETRESRKVKDDEELHYSGKRKHRSSRSHKDSSHEEVEEYDGGKKKISSDRDEVKRKSSIMESGDEADYDMKKGSRSKSSRKSTDERSDRRISESFREPSKRTSSNTSYDRDVEKVRESESRYPDRKEVGREKDYEKSYDDARNRLYSISDKIVDAEKSYGKLDAQGEEDKAGSTTSLKSRDKRRDREKSEDVEPRYSSKSHGEKTGKHRKQSRSPERNGKYYRESDNTDRGHSESDSERNSKGKEQERDYHRDDRSSNDNWRRHHSRQDVEYSEFDHAKHDKERAAAEKLYCRTSYKKDGRARSENFKVLNSETMNDNSESVEIRANLNFGRGIDNSVPNEEDGFHDVIDQGSRRNTPNTPAGRGSLQLERTNSGQSFNSNSLLPPNSNSSNFNRCHQHGPKGGRSSRGRGRPPPGRDPPPGMMGPPFGPIQTVGPNLNAPGGPIPPGVFIPQFPGPLVWSGPRGVDMNMLGVPPNFHPLPQPGPGNPSFGPNIGNGPNHPMFFNQQNLGRGVVPNFLQSPPFNTAGPIVRDISNEKPPSGWNQTRNGPPGKAPSRGEQNDYSQNFVDTGMRPQNFIRELELTSVVEDYPKLRELIQRKDEIVANAATPPMYYKCDLKEHVLTPEFFGTKFDVILVDPPWEEYVHRAPGVTDHLDYWTFEEIQNLKIEAIADTPSFIFLWVGDGVGLEQGRQCLKKWGFRRCEDICWVKTNKKNATPSLRHDSHTILQHSKEHCLMGIKGTVRRSTDGHIIHANIDTDIIIAEEPPDGSTRKPDDMYRIIEHFALGKRRLELFGQDHNIRSGWLTLGKGLSSSNFNIEGYIRNFVDKEGKVWQGSGGRNAPPESPHLILTTPEIEGLRPKSPPPKNQQQQNMPQPSGGGNFGNSRWVSGNSSQNMNFPGMNPDLLGSENHNQVNWGSSPMIRGPENGNEDNKYYDPFGFSSNIGQVVGDRIEINPNRMFSNVPMM